MFETVTRSLLRLTGIGMLAATVSACGGFGSAEDAQFGVQAVHPITVAPQVEVLEVSAPREKFTLSTSDKVQLQNFLRAYKQIGHGSVNVSAPSGSPNERSAVMLVADIREELSGMAVTHVGYGNYRASAARLDAPILVTFKRYTASPTPCNAWHDSFETDFENHSSGNFGCASQNNLAVLVADPADLAGKRALDPAWSARRGKTLEKYKEGEVARTEWDDRDSGTVSEVAE